MNDLKDLIHVRPTPSHSAFEAQLPAVMTAYARRTGCTVGPFATAPAAFEAGRAALEAFLAAIVAHAQLVESLADRAGFDVPHFDLDRWFENRQPIDQAAVEAARKLLDLAGYRVEPKPKRTREDKGPRKPSGPPLAAVTVKEIRSFFDDLMVGGAEQKAALTLTAEAFGYDVERLRPVVANKAYIDPTYIPTYKPFGK